MTHFDKTGAPGPLLGSLLDVARSFLGLSHPLTREDELVMAAEYDAVRGYDQPLKERSKTAYELAEGAPVVRWTPARVSE